MRNLHTRLNSLERRTGIHAQPLPMIIITVREDHPAPDLGDTGDWLTFRQYEAEQAGQRYPAIFFADPEAEAQARQLQAETGGNRP